MRRDSSFEQTFIEILFVSKAQNHLVIDVNQSLYEVLWISDKSPLVLSEYQRTSLSVGFV